MPSFQESVELQDARIDRSDSERFTRTLLQLTRTVWHPDCTFETAIDAIAKSAAEALQVERVSVWHYRREDGLLQALSAYDAVSATYADEALLETLSLQGDDYMRALQQVRTFDSTDAELATSLPCWSVDMRVYLRRHRIRTLLDAPACVEGELQGLISHESINRSRQWTPEEITFAASMGDYVAMAYEIARRKRAEQEVEHLRLHDAATGLPNRDYMLELVRQRMAAPRNDDEILAVVFVHVDPLNAVVVAEAHTSSEVMAAMATEFRQLAQHGDVELARVREDGFAFLVTRSRTKRRVIRLAECCVGATQGLELEGLRLDPAAAVGVAFATSADVDARLLLRQAEEAAMLARTGDRYRYQVFDPGLHDALLEDLRFEVRLRDAFANDQFALHYQPEYDAGTRQWVAAEALLRWRDGERLVAAGEFIAMAESSGLILPLGSWVLHRACSDAARWPCGADGTLPTVRVNVSGRQFDEGGLLEDVSAALAESGLAPGRLSLEITETTLMLDIDRARELLLSLKTVGVGVAIDDFGTGYASLTYLKQLPINVLKIDRSFVHSLPGAAVDLAIVKAVVGLALSLDIDVIAEGVETAVQQDALLQIGVRRMQGWLYGKAMDQDQITALLGTPAA